MQTQLKLLIALGALVTVLGVAGGYFALRNVQASPAVVTQKLSEGTMDSGVGGVFSELALSRDGQMLALVRNNKNLGVWDYRQGDKVQVFESGPKEWIYDPTFSPDGSMLATPSNTPYSQSAGHLLLWDPVTGQRLATIDDISWPICCSAFNSAGTLIAVAGSSTLYLIDPSTRVIVQQVAMQPVMNGVVEAIAFNPSGDLLATAKRNGKVELWQVPNLTLVRTFSVGPSLRTAGTSLDGAPPVPQAMSVTFAHNLPRLAANNSEGSSFVWDLDTGKEIIRYTSELSGAKSDSPAYPTRTNSLFFSVDDRWLLAIDSKGNGIRLLGTEHHKETDNVLTVPPHAVLETMNVTPDGTVAFAYRIFHPGESDPATAKAETWSLQLH